MSDIDIDVLSRVVRDFDAEEEKALLRENGLHPQCKYCGGDYLLRDECEVVALCDYCTHEAVPVLLAERDQLRAERDAAVLSTQMKIACFVSDSLDWDRASDAALYGIVDSIESGAWKDGVKR